MSARTEQVPQDLVSAHLPTDRKPVGEPAQRQETLRFQVPPDTYRIFLAALNATSGLTLPVPARSPLEKMTREELEGRIRGMG